MTPERLAEIGRALYGPQWQTPLAAALGVADRTVRRWMAGSAPVPDGIESDLRGIIADRLAVLRDLIPPARKKPRRPEPTGQVQGGKRPRRLTNGAPAEMTSRRSGSRQPEQAPKSWRTRETSTAHVWQKFE